MSYYRRFVSGFAQLAKPLHALVGKEKKGAAKTTLAQFFWSEECQAAFDSLRKCLTAPTRRGGAGDSLRQQGFAGVRKK